MAQVTTPILTDTTGQRMAAAIENIETSLSAYSKDESDAMFDRYSVWNDVTISASGWNSSTGVYSFQTTYPDATYDILGILPSENTTDAMLEAWTAANCGGYRATNTIKARGTVPTIDLVMKINVRYKGALT